MKFSLKILKLITESISTPFSDGKSESEKSEKSSTRADRNTELSPAPQLVQKKTSIIGKKPDEKADQKSDQRRSESQITAKQQGKSERKSTQV